MVVTVGEDSVLGHVIIFTINVPGQGTDVSTLGLPSFLVFLKSLIKT